MPRRRRISSLKNPYDTDTGTGDVGWVAAGAAVAVAGAAGAAAALTGVAAADPVFDDDGSFGFSSSYDLGSAGLGNVVSGTGTSGSSLFPSNGAFTGGGSTFEVPSATVNTVTPISTVDIPVLETPSAPLPLPVVSTSVVESTPLPVSSSLPESVPTEGVLGSTTGNGLDGVNGDGSRPMLAEINVPLTGTGGADGTVLPSGSSGDSTVGVKVSDPVFADVSGGNGAGVQAGSVTGNGSDGVNGDGSRPMLAEINVPLIGNRSEHPDSTTPSASSAVVSPVVSGGSGVTSDSQGSAISSVVSGDGGRQALDPVFADASGGIGTGVLASATTGDGTNGKSTDDSGDGSLPTLTEIDVPLADLSAEVVRSRVDNVMPSPDALGLGVMPVAKDQYSGGVEQLVQDVPADPERTRTGSDPLSTARITVPPTVLDSVEPTLQLGMPLDPLSTVRAASGLGLLTDQNGTLLDTVAGPALAGDTNTDQSRQRSQQQAQQQTQREQDARLPQQQEQQQQQSGGLSNEDVAQYRRESSEVNAEQGNDRQAVIDAMLAKQAEVRAQRQEQSEQDGRGSQEQNQQRQQEGSMSAGAGSDAYYQKLVEIYGGAEHQLQREQQAAQQRRQEEQTGPAQNAWPVAEGTQTTTVFDFLTVITNQVDNDIAAGGDGIGVLRQYGVAMPLGSSASDARRAVGVAVQNAARNTPEGSGPARAAELADARRVNIQSISQQRQVQARQQAVQQDQQRQQQSQGVQQSPQQQQQETGGGQNPASIDEPLIDPRLTRPKFTSAVKQSMPVDPDYESRAHGIPLMPVLATWYTAAIEAMGPEAAAQYLGQKDIGIDVTKYPTFRDAAQAGLRVIANDTSNVSVSPRSTEVQITAQQNSFRDRNAPNANDQRRLADANAEREKAGLDPLPPTNAPTDGPFGPMATALPLSGAEFAQIMDDSIAIREVRDEIRAFNLRMGNVENPDALPQEVLSSIPAVVDRETAQQARQLLTPYFQQQEQRQQQNQQAAQQTQQSPSQQQQEPSSGGDPARQQSAGVSQPANQQQGADAKQESGTSPFALYPSGRTPAGFVPSQQTPFADPATIDPADYLVDIGTPLFRPTEFAPQQPVDPLNPAAPATRPAGTPENTPAATPSQTPPIQLPTTAPTLNPPSGPTVPQTQRPGEELPTTSGTATTPQFYGAVAAPTGSSVQRLTGAGSGSVPGQVLLEQRNGKQVAVVQGTTVDNGNGTTTKFIPRFEGARTGYNPSGQTNAVYELAPGETGRVTSTTPVDKVTIRTGTTTDRIRGGGQQDTIEGSLTRTANVDNPATETYSLMPSMYIDPKDGSTYYTGMLPRNTTLQPSALAGGVINGTVPAGTEFTQVTYKSEGLYSSTPPSQPGRDATYSPSPALQTTTAGSGADVGRQVQQFLQQVPGAVITNINNWSQQAKTLWNGLPAEARTVIQGMINSQAQPSLGQQILDAGRDFVNGPVTLQRLDGDFTWGTGATKTRATFVDGKSGVYSLEDGRKLSGDGPASLPMWQVNSNPPPGMLTIRGGGKGVKGTVRQTTGSSVRQGASTVPNRVQQVPVRQRVAR